MTGDHYFTAEPSTSPERRYVEFVVRQRPYRLTVASGVFAAYRLDLGTGVLLNKGELPTAATDGALLDLGAGYGPITAVLAGAAPLARIYAVDVNRRALELVRENAELIGAADRIVPATPDEVPDDVTFRQIWSNPPIRIGKPELHVMLARWLPRLDQDGVAWLVVSRNLGGDSLQHWLRDAGWNCDRYASQKGYRVFRVTHGPGGTP